MLGRLSGSSTRLDNHIPPQVDVAYAFLSFMESVVNPSIAGDHIAGTPAREPTDKEAAMVEDCLQTLHDFIREPIDTNWLKYTNEVIIECKEDDDEE